MVKKLFGSGSKKEMFTLVGVIGVLMLLALIALYPAVGMSIGKMMKKSMSMGVDSLSIIPAVSASKSLDDYYPMFQCSCCGKPIDTNCCGMAKQRKDYLDKLFNEGLDEDEIMYGMVKKFGFDILMNSSDEQAIRDYIKSNAPDNPPKIEFDMERHDFGTISQKDGIIETTFLLTNTGGTDLVIENMDSSCMCTEASLIYDGKESPRFGMSMHGGNPEDFELKIAPGDTVTLKVFYDPMAHGVQEKPELQITREITITSNDPVDFQKKIRIELTQLP